MNDILKILTRDSNVNDQDQPLTWYYTYLLMYCFASRTKNANDVDRTSIVHA